MEVIDGMLEGLGQSEMSAQKTVYAVGEFVLGSGERRQIRNMIVPVELSIYVRPGVQGRFALQGSYLLGVRVADRVYVEVMLAKVQHNMTILLIGFFTLGLGLLLFLFGPGIPAKATVEAALRR